MTSNTLLSIANRDSVSANFAQLQHAHFQALMDSIWKGKGKDVSWVNHAILQPGNVRIYITELCNSRCLTCTFWRSKQEVKLDTKTWKDILCQIRNAGISSLEFVGGEPTIRPDLPALIREARELEFSTILVSSNGLLLNDKSINELIGCGVNSFHISLDGLRDTYSFVRGGDWFKNALSAISRIAQAGIPVLVLTNLTRQVIDELETLVGIVRGLGASWAVNIIENLKYGFKGVDLVELAISSKDDIEKVISILSRIKQRFSSTCILREVDILYIGDYLADPQREREVPCSLGFNDIYLDPRGNVYSACMSMNPVGNVLNTQLVEIIQSGQMKLNLKSMLLRQCGGCTCGYPQRAELMHGRTKL